MANNHTNVHATNSQGHQLSINHTSTDSPILPAANLQQLQQIDPSLVQWVVTQTEIEANHRRQSEVRINRYIFIERISGVVAGAFVAVFGLAVGGYLIYKGHDWAGTILCGSTLGVIVTVLVTKQRANSSQDQPPPKHKTKTTRPIAPKTSKK